MSEINPVERINELAAKGVPSLTADEFAELRTLVDTEIAADDDTDNSDEAIERLTALADIKDGLTVRVDAEATATAERETRASDLRSKLKPAVDTPSAETTEPVETETAELEVVKEPEPVVAAAPKRVPLRNVRPTPRPDRDAPSAEATEGASLVASANGKRITNDDHGIETLTQFLNDAVGTLQRNPGRSDVIVASARLEGRAHRIDPKMDPDAVLNVLTRAGKANADALAASGGICGPASVDYNIPTWVNVEEPMKAALPSIDAPRGAIQYTLPVPYATSYENGVAIWSNANDIVPGGTNTGPNSNPTGTGPTVKPCIEIDCTSTVTATVEAITQCAQISNFRGRFNPENVELLMGYLQQAFAKTAEVERIKLMRQAAKHVSFPAVISAARDLLNVPDRVRAYYRSQYRLSDNVQLEVVMERYVREIVRTDLTKAAFPFEGGPLNSLMISDAQIDAMFISRGITPIWVLDDDIGDQSMATFSAGTQGTPVAFPAYPAGTASGSIRVRMLAYPAGTYQRLDGGELNLGVVRDSALNAKNKYQVFSEVFETVAFRGFEATDIRMDVFANGASSGTITPA